jgi:hypothetical protein
MAHETTVERVTNRVWGIFSSLDHGVASNNNRRALLRAYAGRYSEHTSHRLPSAESTMPTSLRLTALCI